MERSEDATICHADLDAFFASVEQRDRPELRGRPVVVGTGVVLAASYEARRHGVRTAMPGHQARRLCPHAVVLPPRPEAYTEASRATFAVFADVTPVVEPLSIDEAFLEVGGLVRLVGPPEQVAADLRRRVRAEVGLPITVGVARTKFLAKVASGVAKPDGLLVVAPDGELDFLHPLPVGRLWGVGPVTARRLAARGLVTVGDVAAVDESVLVGLLGSALGHKLAALAVNRDPRVVVGGHRRSSMGAQRALGRGPHRWETVEGVVLGLVDRIAGRLRSADRVGRTVVLRFRHDDMTTGTRSHTLPVATARTDVVWRTAAAVLDELRPLAEERGLTLVGVAVTNLIDARAVQLALPFGRADDGRLDEAVDTVRRRFGRRAIAPARTLEVGHGYAAPGLPDGPGHD